MRKELRELMKAIRPMGWKVVGQFSNGHYRLQNGNGDTYSSSFSSSDHRSTKNLLSSLKKIDGGLRRPSGDSSGAAEGEGPHTP